jgi:hypothetical protein
MDAVMRIAVMALASVVAIVGVVIMTGLLVRPGIPENIRIILGATVFLYGAYKFTVSLFKKPEKDNR